MSTPIEPVPQTDHAAFAPQAGTPAPAADPDSPPWNVYAAVGLWLASVALVIVCPLVFVIPYIVRRRVASAQLGEFLATDPTAVFLQVLSVIPAHLLTLAVAWLVVTRAGRRPFFASLGWEWGGPFTLWRSVGLAVLLLLLGFGIISLTGDAETAVTRMLKVSRAAAVTTAFLATFTAPFVEEVVYRGVLYSGLRRAVGAAGAVVTVLLLFALVHVPQYWPSVGVIVTILLLSAVLTLVRAGTGRLLPCFVIHLVFNGIQSALIVLEPYLERFAPQAPTPPPPDPALLLPLLRLFY